jgi:hypothetical protein
MKAPDWPLVRGFGSGAGSSCAALPQLPEGTQWKDAK